jgi:hypothetical protein
MRSRWLTAGAIKLHVAALLVVGACLALAWWQLHRALGGNGRSWAYTVMWPLFAVYAIWIWWKLLHEEPEFAGKEQAHAPGDAVRSAVARGPGAGGEQAPAWHASDGQGGE